MKDSKFGIRNMFEKVSIESLQRGEPVKRTEEVKYRIEIVS